MGCEKENAEFQAALARLHKAIARGPVPLNSEVDKLPKAPRVYTEDEEKAIAELAAAQKNHDEKKKVLVDCSKGIQGT